jgi:predicted MPP superfamily phosphohydrolase
LFHPKRGWFRRLERSVSHFLSRRLYPRIPGIQLPYDWVLDRQLTLSQGDVRLPDLPPPFDGLKLLLITDPHAGPFVSPRALQQALARLQQLQPDVILLGGDITSSRTRELTAHRDAFALLQAPLGVFAVLGNHDHYTDRPGRVRHGLEELGIEVLHNRSVRLHRGGAKLSLAGVDDWLLGEPDLDAALAEVTAPTILLSHNPDLFFEAAGRGVALTLSGHTHGGQIRLPGFPVLVRQSRYRLDEGRFRTGESELIVSRGLGAVGLPWRAFCPPEGVLITLRGADHGVTDS